MCIYILLAARLMHSLQQSIYLVWLPEMTRVTILCRSYDVYILEWKRMILLIVSIMCPVSVYLHGVANGMFGTAGTYAAYNLEYSSNTIGLLFLSKHV